MQGQRSRPHQRREGWILFLLLGIVALGILIALLVVTATSHSPSPPAPPPSPPALEDGECVWCDEVRSRVGFPDAEALNAGHSLSSSIMGKMSQDVIPLYQSNFSKGTFLATVDGAHYRLEEDIVFDPENYRASEVSPYSDMAAFTLDFFAAFAVSARDVTLDLNGHWLNQSVAHRLQQRFFALVEVADRPFLRGQGPADFSGSMSGEIVGARDFKLFNGKLGLSSHHGVHGNNPRRLLIADVDIVDYEVAATSINGARDVVFHNVRALGTDTKIPVISTYSSGRFIEPFVEQLLGVFSSLGRPGPTATQAANRLLTAHARLKVLMDQVFEDVVTNGMQTVDQANHPEAYDLFANPSGLIDGNPYGFFFHVRGVGVNGFQCDPDSPNHDNSDHILVEQCEIRNTRGRVDEVVAVRAKGDPTGRQARGPAGDILRMGDIVDPATGAYSGTALSDVKISFYELLKALGIPKDDQDVAGKKLAGTAYIPDDIIAWARGNDGLFAAKVASGDLLLTRGGDSMFHTNKGAVAFRASGGRYVCLERTNIVGVENVGFNGKPVPFPGETEEMAYYMGAEDGGHPGQAPQRGYMGADAYGIIVDAAKSALFRSNTIRNVHSRYMWALGASIFNGATLPHMHDMTITNITSFIDPNIQNMTYPPKTPMAAGVYTATSADDPTLSGFLEINDVRSGGIGNGYDTVHVNTGIEGCVEPGNSYGL